MHVGVALQPAAGPAGACRPSCRIRHVTDLSGFAHAGERLMRHGPMPGRMPAGSQRVCGGPRAERRPPRFDAVHMKPQPQPQPQRPQPQAAELQRLHVFEIPCRTCRTWMYMYRRCAAGRTGPRRRPLHRQWGEWTTCTSGLHCSLQQPAASLQAQLQDTACNGPIRLCTCGQAAHAPRPNARADAGSPPAGLRRAQGGGAPPPLCCSAHEAAAAAPAATGCRTATAACA